MIKKPLSLDKIPLNAQCSIEKMNFTKSKLQRYYDLGISEGTMIIPVFKSIFNDPTAYTVSDTVYAIRKEDAKLIQVNLIKN